MIGWRANVICIRILMMHESVVYLLRHESWLYWPIPYRHQGHISHSLPDLKKRWVRSTESVDVRILGGRIEH